MKSIDAVLVGDSMGNVEYGYDNTLPVTYEQILDRVKVVSSTLEKIPVIADMPFLSYGISLESDICNCGNMLKIGGANGVKIEGGREKKELIRRLTDLGIAVQGHIGLKPQHFNREGGYKIAGKNEKETEELVQDALELEKAGIFSLILECVTEEAAKIITENTKVSTIGIGSGKYCDGQISVVNDLLGLSEYIPSFTKTYVQLDSIIEKALKQWTEDIITGKFPEKAFHRKDEMKK